MQKRSVESRISESLAQKFLREYFHFSEEGRARCLREIDRVLEIYKDDDETNQEVEN